MFKLMTSCAPLIITHQSSPQRDNHCMWVQIEQIFDIEITVTYDVVDEWAPTYHISLFTDLSNSCFSKIQWKGWFVYVSRWMLWVEEGEVNCLKIGNAFLFDRLQKFQLTSCERGASYVAAKALPACMRRCACCAPRTSAPRWWDACHWRERTGYRFKVRFKTRYIDQKGNEWAPASWLSRSFSLDLFIDTSQVPPTIK
jgi:hypothetical protein